MPQHPMTGDELVAFLTGGPARTGKLATVRADGRPHVAPIWFALDPATVGPDSPIGDLVFNTAADSLKGRSLRRDPRVALCVDDEHPPFSFVTIEGIEGIATVGEDLEEVAHWATVIGGRYMGPENAEQYGRRNGGPGELVVRVRPTNIVAVAGVAD
ncbi:MAG: PPOX class F420-dependent oxidoreductase [Acidimicrobiales bacterium]